MSDPGQKYFRFHSHALPDDTLLVTKLEGHEEISQLYRFHLDLVSGKADIDLAAVLKEKAWIGLKQPLRLGGGGTTARLRMLQINGMIVSFDQVERQRDEVRYRAVLYPRLWKLSQEYQSRIFLDRTIPQILEDVLKRAEFTRDDYELRLSGRYASREFVVQYEESDLDFLQRWMEHEGIFYFFEQTMQGEKVVFADSEAAVQSGDLKLSYRPPGSTDTGVVATQTDEWFREEVVTAFACSIHSVPKQVILKDYNYRRPADDLRCSADVSPDGVGTHFEYNNHYKTKEEGNALAKVRAEERKCRISTYSGESNCRAFRAGKVFDLEGHYRPDFNTKYLLTRVHHSGTQDLTAAGGSARSATYKNDFGALSAAATFRPERRTPWPAIKGVMNATVDGSGTGEYAEVDAEGRYKVIMPFDLSGRVEGKASRFIRMQQPYSGNGHGMHFPLHKGAEVLLTFVDGDPDRPIISGAVPNAANPSILTADNHTAGGIRTGGGNAIEMEDTDGHQRVHVAAGSGHSQLVLGSGSEDRAELTSICTAVAGVLMAGQYAAHSSSIYAGKTVTLQSSGFLGVLIPAILSQKYPQTLAAKELSGAGLKLPIPVQTEAVVTLATKLMSFAWKKLWLDWDVKSKFEDWGSYLIRWKGTSRMALNGPDAGDDILIGTDKGAIEIYSGSNLKLRTRGHFSANSVGDSEMTCPYGRTYMMPDGAGMIYWHPDDTRFKPPPTEGWGEWLWNKITLKSYWNPPARKPDRLMDLGLYVDRMKPRCYVTLEDDGVVLRREVETPSKDTARLDVKDVGTFCTKTSLMLAGGGGPATPKDGPFIELDEDITIDCSKTKKAEVFIKAANKRQIVVNDQSICLEMGDNKTSLIVWGDGNIDIVGTKSITLEGKTVVLKPKNKMIDCSGATLTNCKGIK